MYKYLIIVFLLIISKVPASEQVDVNDLLNKLQENQKNYAAYSATSVITSEIKKEQETYFSRRETVIFIDGERIDFRNHQWRNLKSKDQATPLEDADFRSFLWDGSSFYYYTKLDKYDCSLNITSNSDDKIEFLSTGYEGTPLIGIFNGDQIPVYSILRKAKTISLREQLEKIGESKCYVINAVTDHGEYTVWIDPEHGYNIAKAEVSKKKGDIHLGKPLSWMGDTTGLGYRSEIVPLSGYSFNLLNVRFEKINSVWVPVEADYETTLDYGGRITKAKTHHKQTHTDLNPDFKSLKAFIPDIPDGTQVYKNDSPGTKYIWLDGKPVM
ncbi:MAG: hypothetical protein JXA96_06450 [Sedimentisphaerales bacterium]|nr:hypothetical protein [Sedimentisphaerales bacterium]